MDLIDAIATNTSAKSPVELSTNPVFHRQYGSLHDAVDNFLVPVSPGTAQEERTEHQRDRMRIVSEYYPEPVTRNFFLLAIDTTECPRPYANTLGDRGIHYHPNPAPGNRPVMVGHSFSVVAGLLEKNEKNSPPWVLPLLTQSSHGQEGNRYRSRATVYEGLFSSQSEFSRKRGHPTWCRLKGQSPGKRNHLPVIRKKAQRSENEERSP